MAHNQSNPIIMKINQLCEQGETWRAIADLPEFEGIPPGSLCSFAKGDWEPQENETRRRLGLKEIILQKVYRDKKGKFSKAG